MNGGLFKIFKLLIALYLQLQLCPTQILFWLLRSQIQSTTQSGIWVLHFSSISLHPNSQYLFAFTFKSHRWRGPACPRALWRVRRCFILMTVLLVLVNGLLLCSCHSSWSVNLISTHHLSLLCINSLNFHNRQDSRKNNLSDVDTYNKLGFGPVEILQKYRRDCARVFKGDCRESAAWTCKTGIEKGCKWEIDVVISSLMSQWGLL